MAYLTEAWQEKRSFDFTGGISFRLSEQANDTKRGAEFNEFLSQSLKENPALFKDFPNNEIVDVLIALDKVDPDTDVLVALYKAYKPWKNHELHAWELEKRIQFFKALNDDPEIRAITDRWTSPNNYPSDDDKKILAERQHLLQAAIYESTPARVSPYDTPKAPTGPYGSQNIWSASFNRQGNTLYYNTYAPEDPRELLCTFRQNARDFQSTIAHDTDHTVQNTIAERVMKFRAEQTAKTYLGDKLNDHMVTWVSENLPGGLGNGINRMILKSDEMRNFGLLMHYSVQGNYYLSQRYANGTPRPQVTFDVYKTNPSENHTYNFQRQLDKFLTADQKGRANMLKRMENLKERYLSAPSAPLHVPKANYPQMELSATT